MDNSNWWQVPLTVLILTAIGGLIIASILITEAIQAIQDRMRYRRRNESKPRNPSLIKEYIRAKHDKICPEIKFVKSDGTDNTI